MNCRITFVYSCLIAIILQQLPSAAFETSTHRLINQRAAESLILSDSGPTFDEFLKYTLQFPDGYVTILNGQTIRDWLGTGGVAEDQFMSDTLGQKLGELAGGVVRSPRHFHTPLKTWDQSGLKLGGFQFESSPRWAQLADQGFTGKAAWADARSTYFRALTSTDPQERERLFSETFKILGQLMHLVADMGSVAHTRNAQHILGDRFEEFMGDPLNEYLVAGFKGMDPSYVRFTPTNDPVATVPVARLWDTNTYNGTNPEVTIQTTAAGETVGLAEFTSANFFSQSTMLKIAGADPVLPNPAIDQLVPGPIEDQRQYWKKDGPGFEVTHMAVESVFNLFLPSTWWRFSLDDTVFQEYATALLPRAIGYSAGILDYFFRGYIGADVAHAGPLPVGSPPTTLTVTDMANSSLNEETAAGKMALVLRYDYQTGTSENFPQFVVSNAIPVNISRSAQSVVFPFGSLPFPTTFAGSVIYTASLVYQGMLGQESDLGGSGAVVVGHTCSGEIDVPVSFVYGREPDPPLGNSQPALYVGVLHGCVQ